MTLEESFYAVTVSVCPENQDEYHEMEITVIKTYNAIYGRTDYEGRVKYGDGSFGVEKAAIEAAINAVKEEG